jgi:hypothetical protein
MARTALTPTPIPTPSPIFVPEDSPPGPDVVGIALAEGDDEGLVVGVAIVVVDNIEELELVVESGFCVVSLPFTTKSPSPALQQPTEPSPTPSHQLPSSHGVIATSSIPVPFTKSLIHAGSSHVGSVQLSRQ